MMRSLCQWVASGLPKRTILRGDSNAPYLERYYLLGDPRALKYFPEDQRRPRWWQKLLGWLPTVYLHRFRASDDDDAVHNHPWEAKSIILAGGYREWRRIVSDVVKGKTFYVLDCRDYLPGDVNVIGPETFHRVELLEGDCWSLIKVGKKLKTWGFYDMRTKTFEQWTIHQAKKKARVNTIGGAA